MTNLGIKIKRVSCLFLLKIPDEMKSYPDSLYKTHGESTDDENLAQLVDYKRVANSVGIEIQFVIRKSS